MKALKEFIGRKDKFKLIEIFKVKGELFDEITYVIKDIATGEMAIIDPGTSDKQLFDVIANCDNLKYILLTHGHIDHIIGLPMLHSKCPDAVLVACKNEKEMLGNAMFNGTATDYYKEVVDDADKYVTDNDILHLGESIIEFIETPGHTKGSMCIKIGSDLFSGDTLFYKTVGSTEFYGGNWEDLKSSIKNKLFTLPPEIKVYPGHGKSTTIGYEKENNPFV